MQTREGKTTGQDVMKRTKRKYRCRVRSPETIRRTKQIRRSKANARERRRMHNLNEALEKLRRTLPQLPDEPKLTKIGEYMFFKTFFVQIILGTFISG